MPRRAREEGSLGLAALEEEVQYHRVERPIRPVAVQLPVLEVEVEFDRSQLNRASRSI